MTAGSAWIASGAPEVQNRHRPAQAHDHGHVVFDEQHGQAETVPDVPDEAGKVLFFRLVHAGSGLVQQKDLWGQGQRAGDLQASARAIGQAGGGSVHPVAQAHQGHQFARARQGLALKPPRPGRAEHAAPEAHLVQGVPGHPHVVQHAHAAEQPDVLEGPGHAQAGNGGRGFAGDVLAEEPDRSRRGPGQAREHVEERSLARAVGADEAEDLAFLHLEAHIRDSHEPAEGLGKVVHCENGAHDFLRAKSPAMPCGM